MVWLWKRGLMSSTVKCWCLLLIHRWSCPWSRERGVLAGVMAPLKVQACWDHPWKKVGDEKRKGRMGWAHLPTDQLPVSCSHLHKQTRKRLCPWFENEVAEDRTCHTDVSWARAAQCGHGAVVGVRGKEGGRAGRAAAVAWQVLLKGWQGLQGRHKHHEFVQDLSLGRWHDGESQQGMEILSRVTDQEMGWCLAQLVML